MSLAELSNLLPLPTEELQQVLDYAATLSKPEAVTHFTNLLGDAPAVVEFISTFNGRRKGPDAAPERAPSSSSAQPVARQSQPEIIEPVPKYGGRGGKKKKAPIHTPQARKVEEYAGPAGKAYSKHGSDFDYIPQRTSAPGSNHASRPGTPPKPTSGQAPASAAAASGSTSKAAAQAPPKQGITTAGGYLISDMPSKGKSKSTPVTRTSTPKPTGATTPVTKVAISGGTPMAGQSTALTDLDAAIRSLEITTNPTLENVKARRCNCVATRHPIQAAAPNCLHCGKVICLKEGLGPCTFCGTPLLSSQDVQAMVRELKDERGREKMAANASANRRADVGKTPAPFTQPRGDDDSAGPSLTEAAIKAREHRDKLLNFQAQNAQRTTVHDEAADFDVSGAMSGVGSMWATPEERARELKRQQKIMREMEWNARPEYEKRQQVVSIDLKGRRIVKTMAAIERPATPEEDEDAADSYVLDDGPVSKASPGGAFSANPLLGAVMRPIFEAKGEGRGEQPRKKGWRRVQDDLDDNEGVILDGGVRGHGAVAAVGDEPECG